MGASLLAVAKYIYIKFCECLAVKGVWSDVEIGGTSNILKT